MSTVNTVANQEAMKATWESWNSQGRQVRAWSGPVAARYGKRWEFFVKADLMAFTVEPDSYFFIKPENFSGLM